MTPDSAMIVPSLKISKFLNVFFNDITIPLYPLSLTNRLEPLPAKKVFIFFEDTYFNISFNWWIYRSFYSI